MSKKRKATSKRLRFDVFKRDSFTCQYCGAQPPDAVLVCDHIQPVALDGHTTIDNLITACETCNQGKAAKPLGDRAIRPDADLMYLEMQQEIAELRRFQEAERTKDAILREIAEDFQDRWCEITDSEWAPSSSVLIQLLRKYSAFVVQQAVLVTAKRVADRDINNHSSSWIPYLWGVAKRVSAQMEDNGNDDN